MSDELLAAGFSAALNKKVMTQTQFDAYKKTPEGRYATAKKLTIETVHQVSLQRNDDVPPAQPSEWQYQVFAQCGSSKRACVTIYHCDTIARLKYVVMQKLHISAPATEVRLTYQDRDLASDKTIGDYQIKDNADIKVLLRVRGGAEEVSILDSSLRDSTYDYQFPSMSDGFRYYRGPHEYLRPYGWNRLALKVKGKFGDDTWLGEHHMTSRTRSSPGEWSVSYHGTRRMNAPGIAREGFRLDKCERFMYGEGIYSSPKIEVAEGYAVTFEYGGECYKLVFQNRCNPDDINEVKNGDYWVTKNDRNIRPYGICLKGSSGWCTIL